MSRHRLTFRYQGLLALFVLGAVLIGALCGDPPAGRSVRLPAGQSKPISDIPPGHFLAGSERSGPILAEISATLKRIDDRLARLEKIAAQAVEADRKE